MSHDGSSAKSYIRHATEKERLDNLAFASFPEDYLPYAASQGQGRAPPPPYLLWGEDRRRRANKRRRNPKCAGALLCAIALVVIAILAVVAISVYLGVVTNLFRSPVVSVSGRFVVSEEFSEDLLNSSSSQFLEKADVYQSKVEKAFLSSSLEPAFIAARIYSFRPGLAVFFRVYLDRRKIGEDDGDTPPKDLVRELVAQKLAQDPNSVHVEENEELLSADVRSTEKSPATHLPKPTAEEPPPQQHPPSSGGVGEWRPVPIEDSVSPSFGDGPPQSRLGSIRSPEEFTRTPTINLGSAEEPAPQKSPPTPANSQEGVGFVRAPAESRNRNPKIPAARRESTGSVRLLPSEKPKSDSSPPEGVGSVHILDDTGPEATRNEGVGSVRLLDETPKTNAQSPGTSRAGVGLARVVLEEKPVRQPPALRYIPDGIRAVEQPPTLAPSVSLVVRNRSRSDKPRNLATTRLDKSQGADLKKTQNLGVGSIHEIITEVDSFPLPPPPAAAGISSRLLDLSLEETTESELMNEITTEITEKENVKQTRIYESSSEAITNKQNDLVLFTNADFETNNQSLPSKESPFDTETPTSGTPDMTPVSGLLSVDGATTKQIPPQGLKISPLENILFSHAPNPSVTTVGNNVNGNSATTKAMETSSTDYDTDTTETELPPALSTDYDADTIETELPPALSTSTIELISTNKPDDAPTSRTLTPAKENSDAEDIHSSIVNHSQYPNPEPHYHTIEKENNNSSIESFEVHTLEGHGFHKPMNTSRLPTENLSSSLGNDFTSGVETSVENQSSEELSTATHATYLESNNSKNESEKYAEQSLTPEYSEFVSNISIAYGEIWPEDGDDVGNITTEDNSQQPKVVSQLQSHLLSNDIEGQGESGDEGLFEDPFQEEILRHITTIRPQNASDACAFGLVPCSVSGCGVRCDMRKDCPDNGDEHGCTCSDLLRAMGQSQKVCDGVDDCSDGSDESDCPWCPSAEHFRCPGSRTCITLDRVCDGREDCPGAQDEKRCVSLANSSEEAESPEYRPTGYLVVRRNGRWGKLCLDSLAHSPDLDRRTRELGRAVCTALTYRNMSSSIRTRDEIETEDAYHRISVDTANNRSATSLFEPSLCEGREVLKVQCESLECGLRPSAPPTQRRRIVGGRSAEGAGTWPWAAALYREGEFQCGAALISDHWLVSAAHCFYSSQGAYWVARLGVLRRGSELQSSWEQVRRIRDIILHPQYEDVGFINDISLLRMERPVPFSDSLRPICLPSSAGEDASLWHGRRCSVVGWGKLYEIGHTFPDSLQEVRLPVISSGECQRRSLFLPAYRITPNMFCAGYERGGRDACLGDSGGPMACQRPDDGRWVLLGVTSNGDGCGRPNRPGVYTQAAGYLSWLREVTSNQKVFAGKTGSESRCSGGVRCRLGRCIQQPRVCDGRRDCAAGEDEDKC